MENEWLYIDEIDRLPETDFVHCDTRDFHVLCIDGSKDDKTNALKKLVRNRLRQEQFLFRRDEILGTLKALEMGSGGPGDWRMLRLKPCGHHKINWLKYIRFAWTGETINMGNKIERVYVAYADDYGQFTQLSREDLVPENLDNEYLNHIIERPGKNAPETPTAVIECKTMEDLEKLL